MLPSAVAVVAALIAMPTAADLATLRPAVGGRHGGPLRLLEPGRVGTDLRQHGASASAQPQPQPPPEFAPGGGAALAPTAGDEPARWGFADGAPEGPALLPPLAGLLELEAAGAAEGAA